MPGLEPVDAVAFARLSRELLAEPAADPTTQRIVDLAVTTIPGCHYAGITVRSGGRLTSPASSDPLVIELDQFQVESGQGPCVDAARDDTTYLVGDTARDERWPRWQARAVERGIRAVLSVQLEGTDNDAVGALNLYSTAVDGFDAESVLIGEVYAVHAANALVSNRKIEGLTVGMRTRQLIGIAQGLLMAKYRLSEEQSFQFLRRTSQEANIKLRDVARQVIDELGNGDAKPE